MSNPKNDKSISEQEYKSLLSSITNDFLVLSPDLKIISINGELAYRFLGLSNEDIGAYFLQKTLPQNNSRLSSGLSKLHNAIRELSSNSRKITLSNQSVVVISKDGSKLNKNFHLHLNPVNDGKNTPENILIWFQEVDAGTDFSQQTSQAIIANPEVTGTNEHSGTSIAESGSMELKSAYKIIGDYKFALDASSIVAITDRKGKITEANDNFCKISKYSKAELIGKDHRIINSGHHSKLFFEKMWATISSGEIWKGELKNKAKDGTIYWVDTTIVPFPDEEGKPYQYMAIRSDITKRKQAEEQLLTLKIELEEKVKERTLELTDLLEKEREINHLKTRFVSMASHEFRTPLSAILSSVSLIGSYSKPEHEDKRGKHIDRIKSSVSSLTDILNDFLSLDKLEQGKVETSHVIFNLQDFAEDLCEEVKGMLKPGQFINYNHYGEAEIILDKKILRNLILNLLTNAIKYSADASEVIFETNVDDGKINITIQDQGIGIPDDQQAELFTKFFRAANVADIQGTGLGLNIVKKYVELLNGSITFVSKENIGTTFFVGLPKIDSLLELSASDEFFPLA